MKKFPRLFIDSRLLSFHQRFGSVATPFAPESHFGDGVPRIIEQPNEVDCTAISLVKVGYSQKKTLYDIPTLWNETPHGQTGADPRMTIAAAIKYGLLNMASKAFEKLWVSYYDARDGDFSTLFDNVRSAMTLASSSIQVNGYWYAEWENLEQDEVMPAGLRIVSDHSYTFLDWKVVNGVTMALIDADMGYTTYMPQDIFNAEMAKPGCSVLMPTNAAITAIRNRNFFTWIMDCIQNFIMQAQTVETEVKSLPDTSAMPSKITQWAQAIALWEGARADLNNPGDLKLSTLTASWGAMQGFRATDGGYIAKFENYEKGFLALVNFLTLGCENELKAFHQARTLQAFMKIYAGNPPQTYITGIAQKLGVSLDTDISTFLS